MPIYVIHNEPGADLAYPHFVRTEVFQKEQGVPVEIDFDGQDETSHQFIAWDSDLNAPIGTARYRYLDSGVIKVERVAVLPQYRGKNIGQLIMEKIEEVAYSEYINSINPTEHQPELTITLNSQMDAANFYDRLGYERSGEVFLEAGIEHIKMLRKITSLEQPIRRDGHPIKPDSELSRLH